jgi:uncharacterized membrane protein
MSDAVIAIVITVMVLELRPPAVVTPAAVASLWPDFLSYAISFTFVAIYWVNHRYVLHHLKVATEPVLWANAALLFLISLIPFSTAAVGRSELAAFPVQLYGAVLLTCGVAFAVLRARVTSTLADPVARRRLNGPRVQLIGAATAVMLLLAIVLSVFSPPGALALIVLSSLLHITPLTRQSLPPSR